MSVPRLLLVDDNENVRITLQAALKINGFDVVTAAGVNDALQCIAAEKFDVLISDLHMPESGDGLTVVSAMRNAHPAAITLVYSGYPEMEEAANAILLQADQILLKPLDIHDLVKVIRENLANGSKATRRVTESVANILEGESERIIQLWLARVQNNEELMKLPLSSRSVPVICRSCCATWLTGCALPKALMQSTRIRKPRMSMAGCVELRAIALP